MVMIIKELANPAQFPSGFSSISKFFNWVVDFTQVKISSFIFLTSARPQPLITHNSSLDHNAAAADDGHEKMELEDLRMVMDRLYEACDDDELSRLIFAEEPRMEELKQVFDVYDENRDGFIDAEELQRVLWGLGLEGWSDQVDKCKKMINVADDNGDGVIDFNEFVKFMGIN